MKHDIDNMEKNVKKACDDLVAAGGINECSDTDWQAFGAAMDIELERNRAYIDEMKDIMKMINPNSKYDEKDNE